MSGLRELQRRFWALCTRPGPIDADADLAGLVAASPTLPARACLDIYAEMYFCRIHDTLAEQHPGLRRVLGDDGFHALVLAYLGVHRPRTADLADAGDRLPDFLAGRDPERPWLAELAALERAQVVVFTGRDAVPLAPDGFAGLDGEALAALPLILVLAHVLVTFGHAVERLAAAPEEPPGAEPGLVVVWRHDGDGIVRLRRADELERALLPRLAAGCRLGELAESLAETVPIAGVAGLLFDHLRRWAGEGLLAAPVDVPGPPHPAVRLTTRSTNSGA